MEKNKTIYQISVKSNYLKVEMEIFDEKNDDTYRTVINHLHIHHKNIPLQHKHLKVFRNEKRCNLR